MATMSQTRLKGRITEMVKAAFVLRLKYDGPLDVKISWIEDEKLADRDIDLGPDQRWSTYFEGTATSEQTDTISFEGTLSRAIKTGRFTAGEIKLAGHEIVKFNDPDEDGETAEEDTD